jgi:ferritin-like metal-binding protein YciE
MAANKKLTNYLREAYDAERAAAEGLAEVIGRTARADHRVHLESHLEQEREHARRLEVRLREVGYGESPATTVVSLVQGIVADGWGIVTFPLALLRGSADPAGTLRNAEELVSAEAREVARYQALERLAKRAGDDDTAALAASIREQEEAQLELLERDIPHLADAVLGGDAAPRERPQRKPRQQKPAQRKPAQRSRGQRRRPAAETSAPSRRPRTRSEAAGPDRAEAARIRETERAQEEAEAETVSIDPGADPEGPGPELHVEEPWPGYDSLSAAEVAARVGGEGEAVRAAVRLYEAAHEAREVVMRATSDG